MLLAQLNRLCFLCSQLACIHEDQASKTFEEIEEEKEQHKIQLERNPEQAFHPNPDMRLGRKGLVFDQEEMKNTQWTNDSWSAS